MERIKNLLLHRLSHELCQSLTVVIQLGLITIPKFLKSGNKVKASIRFRGREMGHQDQGHVIMTRFAESCAEIANVEKPAKLEGRNMLMFLAPKPVK